MGEVLVFDSESDNFAYEATKLHCLQIGTAEGTDVTVYCDALVGYPSLAEGLARLARADRVIGHNAIKHDFPLINRLHPGTLRRAQLRDTLTMARLMDPEEREHSLGAWGRRLGHHKGDFKGPWDVCTEEMLTYARQDVVVGRALYQKVRVVETWGESCELEHETAWAMAAQERNGFRLDVRKAQELEAVLRGEIAQMTLDLRDVFPPRWVRKDKETFTPKDDNKRMGYVAGCPLTKVTLQAFNPASRIQVGQRLQALGWKPKKFGQDGHPTVDEAILATLPYPEAKRLVTFFTAQKLLGQLSDGKNGWLKLVKPDGRVYGAVNPNGACTGRMSHFAPNMAQVASDHRMRELWLPREGWVLVGCDAEGLEARMLAHYLARYDGGAFGKMLLEGRKEDATDVHSANRDGVRKIGFAVDRQGAKTLLYALMYGAGDFKLGMTVTDNLREQGLAVPKGSPKAIGVMVRGALSRSMKGINTLIDDVKKAAKIRGYLIGLDGRHVAIRSEHSALNTLLQGGGAIVMKKALNLFMQDRGENRVQAFALCANVHDEVQIEALDWAAHEVGRAFADCITLAGNHFNLRCPLAGDFKIGPSWAATH